MGTMSPFYYKTPESTLCRRLGWNCLEVVAALRFASAMDDEARWSSMPVKELLSLCRQQGVDVTGITEKAEVIAALAGAPNPHEASQKDEEMVDAPSAGCTQPCADMEAMEEDEEELMRQAMLMSTETEDALKALPVRELQARLEARGISTQGLIEKADLVAALQGQAVDGGGNVDSLGQSSTSASLPRLDQARRSDDVQVLLTFRQRVRLLSASIAGRPGLEGCGKIVVPRSWLTALALVLGGELPRTLLLRLSHHESTVCVGVDEFAEDAEIFAAAEAAGCGLASESGMFAELPFQSLAAAIVPRWVLSSLGCVSGELALVSVISLPRATWVRLQPHANRFAEVLRDCKDPRELLTELINGFVAVSVGDTIQLKVGDERHAVDIMALRGLPNERCGLPTIDKGGVFDVDAAMRSLGQEPWECTKCTLLNKGEARMCDACGAAHSHPRKGPAQPTESVRCACLVDVDLEVDLAPSVEMENEQMRALSLKAETERAAAEQKIRDEEAEAAAAAQACAEGVRRKVRCESAAQQLADFFASQQDPSGDPNVAVCAVRLPNGSRCKLRLRQSDPLITLWWLVESEWLKEPSDHPLLPSDFSLSTGFPRKLFRRPESAEVQFQAIGLGGGQHMFMVETQPAVASETEGGYSSREQHTASPA